MGEGRWTKRGRAALALVAGLLSLGARCNPDAPACSAGQGDDPVTCAANELPACRDQCVVPVGSNAPCDQDPCAPAQEGAPQLCGSGLACVDEGNGARCTPVNPTLPAALRAGFCDVESPACGTGTFCRGFEDAPSDFACAGVVRPSRVVGIEQASGICAVPRHEGANCDSDWANVLAGEGAHCMPCAPGLACQDDPSDLESSLVCMRPCATSGDCACNTGESDRRDTCVEGVCEACAPLGKACETAADCCLGSTEVTCAKDHTCHTCSAPGEARDPYAGCCHFDAEASGGVCPDVCYGHSGEAELPGSSCDASVVCAGTWQCDAGGANSECVPIPNGQTEVYDCNRVDEDCDGAIDEGLDDCVGNPYDPDHMDEPCTLFTLPGHWACDGRTPYCRIETGWCAYDGTELIGDSLNCGSAGQPCDEVSCLAGDWCCSIEAFGTSNRAVCSPIGEVRYPDHGRDVVTTLPGYAPPACWRPGDTSGFTSCPSDDNPCFGSTCEACAGRSGCGYCETWGSCFEGNAAGPYDVTCEDVDWVRDVRECR